MVEFDAPVPDKPPASLPIVLVLDTSASMQGKPINLLNAWLADLANHLSEAPPRVVEVAIVRFPPVQTVVEFCTAADFQPPVLTASGSGLLGAAILYGLRLIENRIAFYRANSLQHYRPLLLLASNGNTDPPNDWRRAVAALHDAEAGNRISVFVFGVPGTDMKVLSELSRRPPITITDSQAASQFPEMFQWLSRSVRSVGSDQPPLILPPAPAPWSWDDLSRPAPWSSLWRKAELRTDPINVWEDDPRADVIIIGSVEAAEAEYTVWYGTNRLPKKSGDESKGYSARRDTTVHYGSCRVFIPKSHKIGSTGSPWWKRVLTGKDDRLQLQSIQALDTTAYWRAISEHLASVNRDENFAVVFVHGYNVSFEEAALRAAQIGFDLSIRSAMAFFSWPSQGTLKGYLADAAAIEASETAITDYLIDFGNLSGAQTVHIIAHSMGNRAVVRALHQIAERARRRSKAKFGQIILAAADVDTDVFRQHSAAVARMGQRTTLYVSTRDHAIGASRWLHDFPRVGLMPPVVVESGIDTINVTNIDLTQLGHGYIADARDVLRDIYELIARGTPPRRRFGLRDARTGDGRHYWIIGA
jgi:esterase/lipase superfamily enzyme/uncharacterized protein YegL